MELQNLETRFEALMQEMIAHQQAKVLTLARSRLKHLTGDDVLNPHDYPVLMQDPHFNYEEGLAAGLIAAEVALRRELFRTSGVSEVPRSE